jgi:hypothetical protein
VKPSPPDDASTLRLGKPALNRRLIENVKGSGRSAGQGFCIDTPRFEHSAEVAGITCQHYVTIQGQQHNMGVDHVSRLGRSAQLTSCPRDPMVQSHL